MSRLSDETPGFLGVFSEAFSDHVAGLHPECLTKAPALLVRAASPPNSLMASVCAVEGAQDDKPTSPGDSPARTGLFDGRSYYCSRTLLSEEGQFVMDTLTGQAVILYLVCVRPHGSRSYYQAQAIVTEATPASYRLSLQDLSMLDVSAPSDRNAASNPVLFQSFTTIDTAASAPPFPSKAPMIATETAPVPPDTTSPAAPQAVQGTPVAVKPVAQATTAAEEPCCECTLWWWFFGFGWVLWPLFLAAVIGLSCKARRTKSDQNALIGNSIGLGLSLLWIIITIAARASAG